MDFVSTVKALNLMRTAALEGVGEKLDGLTFAEQVETPPRPSHAIFMMPMHPTGGWVSVLKFNWDLPCTLEFYL